MTTIKYNMARVLLVFALIAVGQVISANRISYSGYALYRLVPQTDKQLEQLRSLVNFDKEDGIQFWTEPSRVNSSVDVMVAPEEQNSLAEQLRHMRIPMRKIMHDVGQVIEKTSSPPANLRDLIGRDSIANGTAYHQTRLLEPEVFHKMFHPYQTIEAKLAEYTKDPRVSVEVAGLSYEKRNLYLVKISSDPNLNKPIIFLDAGHHAREWISHATILYIMDSLLNPKMVDVSVYTQKSLSPEEASQRSNLNGLLTKFDFWFVPVINPDGYEYSRTSDRLWRKTRSRNNYLCSGVDPNRNYPFHWRECGASWVPCEEIYAGPRALSEPETETLARILVNNRERIIMYLSLHAYSQLVLTPYGLNSVIPENFEELKAIASEGAKAIETVRGTKYRYGSSAGVLYPATGGSDDFAHGVAGIKLAYTIELPDRGKQGFLMPPTEIVPVGVETLAGIRAMISAISEERARIGNVPLN